MGSCRSAPRSTPRAPSRARSWTSHSCTKRCTAQIPSIHARAPCHPAFSGFDALLTPTTPMAAIPLDSVDQSKTPAHFTRFANLLDLCALAVPNGTANGLPTSLQIIGRGYDEETVLRIGGAYQRVTD